MRRRARRSAQPLGGIRAELHVHFQIVGDSNSESGVTAFVTGLSGPTRNHFVPRNYGVGMPRICIVLMCRAPELKFKRRMRFAKKEGTLYMDVMLHLSEMTPLSHDERRRIIIRKVEQELSTALGKYDFSSFDRVGFEHDLHEWFAPHAA